MASWLVPRTHLTPEQTRAVELSLEEHRVVFGAPGSGKTIVLLYRARYLIDAFNIPAERFRILVFTNVLKQYIRSALNLLRLPESSVMTFNAWCSDYYRQNIGGRLPWNKDAKQPDFGAIEDAVRKHAMKMGKAAKSYDFIMIDEGQDLNENAFRTLTAVSAHVTVFMDHKQQVYDKGSTKQQILDALGRKRINLSLLEAYRCSPFIVTLASRFIEDDGEREAYMQQTRVPQTEKETPLVYVAEDFEDERERLIDVVKTRQAMGDRIAVILPQKRMVYGFAKGLREAGLEVEVPEQWGGKSEYQYLDFTTDLPKLMPYPSAKGITFDSVLMPRLVPQSFGSVAAQRLERLLFVGITRATKWVYLSGVGGQLHIFRKLGQLAGEGHISLQRGGDQTGLFDGDDSDSGKVSSQDNQMDDLTDLF